MEISRHHGREFWLTSFPFTSGQRDGIFRHLFRAQNHASRLVLEKSGAAARIAENAKKYTTMTKDDTIGAAKTADFQKYAPWMGESIAVLRHLAVDLELAKKIDDWDIGILSDVFALTDFLYDCCGAREHLLAIGTGSNTFGRKEISVKFSAAKTYRGLAQDLKDGLQTVATAKMQLYFNQKDKLPGIDQIIGGSGDHTVPTATLRELFIFNEAFRMKGKILSSAVLASGQQPPLSEEGVLAEGIARRLHSTGLTRQDIGGPRHDQENLDLMIGMMSWLHSIPC